MDDFILYGKGDADMGHYFDQEPEAAARELEFDLDYSGKKFTFFSSSGVFSRTHLDEGSKALLDACRELFGAPGHGLCGDLLDLGCGYGPIGIVLKRLYPDLTLLLADCNRRALELARRNCRANRIGYTEILEVDAWKGLEGRMFDFVLSNPPIRAGKDTVYDFFSGASTHLRSEGQFITVVSKHQGADSARRELRQLFGNCETIERAKGFHVMRCLQMSVEKAGEPASSVER